jgi:NTE family protein
MSIEDWQDATRKWRCRLSTAEAKRLGAGPNWRCSNIKFEIAEVSFDQLDAARMALVEKVPTRFNLPAEQVDLLVDAGTDLVLAHPAFNAGGRRVARAR